MEIIGVFTNILLMSIVALTSYYLLKEETRFPILAATCIAIGYNTIIYTLLASLGNGGMVFYSLGYIVLIAAAIKRYAENKEITFIEAVRSYSGFTRKGVSIKTFTSNLTNEIKQLSSNKSREVSNHFESDTALVLRTEGGEEHILEGLHRGSLIVGGAGSGKSESLIKPFISNFIRKGYAGIVYDWKFDELSSVVEHESAHRDDMQYYYLNFNDISKSHRCNPLEHIEEKAYARQYAETLLLNLDTSSIQKRDFFIKAAKSFLAAGLWLFKCDYPDICTLPHVVRFLLHDNIQEVVDVISRNEDAKELLSPVLSGLKSERQTAAVVSTLQELLTALLDDKMAYVLSGNDFNLDINNPAEPKVLCVGNYQPLAGTFSPVLSLIIDIAIKQMNIEGKQKSFVLLDEAPTLYIPNIDQLPATGRSNGICVVYCVQDISQTVGMYDEVGAEKIVSNLGNKWFGRTTSSRTLREMKETFGRYDHEFDTISHSQKPWKLLPGLSSGYSQTLGTSIQEREVIQQTEVRQLREGEFYNVSVNSNIESGKLRYEQYPTHKKGISTINKVTDDDIKDNRRRIINDIAQILGKPTEAIQGPF